MLSTSGDVNTTILDGGEGIASRMDCRSVPNCMSPVPCARAEWIRSAHAPWPARRAESLPVNLLYIPKSARAYFFPNLSKIITSAAAPLVFDPTPPDPAKAISRGEAPIRPEFQVGETATRLQNMVALFGLLLVLQLFIMRMLKPARN